MNYPLSIVGGGAVGTAVAYIAARYTNIDRIVLHEKDAWWGAGASNPKVNSQTLHLGRIESNFEKKDALKLHYACGFLRTFIDRYAGISKRNHELLLGVGPEEAIIVRDRYAWAKDVYPEIKLLGREGIAELAPKITEGRDQHQEIIALSSDDGRTVDFAKVAAALVAEAQATGKLEILLNNPVVDITRDGENYRLTTETEEMSATQVVIAAGAHSLLFAHRMGVAKDYFELPVAGGFFYILEVVKLKAYTIQNPAVPFAAVHLDHDLTIALKTRCGPWAVPAPMIDMKCDNASEYWSSATSFLKQLTGASFGDTLDAFRAGIKLLRDPTLRHFLFENLAYVGPNREQAFLPKIQKIVPSICVEDVTVARDEFGDLVGGIRPQLVNRRTKQMLKGTGRFVDGNAVYVVTPSPGASKSLGEAFNVVQDLVKARPAIIFDKERFLRDHLFH